MNPKRCLGAAWLVAALTAAGGAQPRLGDYIVSGFSLAAASPYTGIFSVDPQTLAVRTLHLQPGTTRIHEWVGMLERNTDLGILTFTRGPAPTPGSGTLFRLAPGGTTTSLARFAAPASITGTNDPTAAIWDPRGRLLITAGRTLYRYDPGPGRLTSVRTFPRTSTAQTLLQSVAVGPDPTGFGEHYYLVSAFGALGTLVPLPPAFFRFDPQTGTVQTLDVSGLRRGSAVAYDYGTPSPSRRRFLATRQVGLTAELVAVDLKSGALTTVVRFSAFVASFVKRLKRRETAVVIGRPLTSPPTTLLHEVDLRRGAVTRTIPVKLPGLFQPTGLEVYGSNTLQPRGQLPLGALSVTFDLLSNDPSLAGKTYTLALALDSTPPAATLIVNGVPVTLDLAPDLLFFLSVGNPGVVGLTNSVGTLDPGGNAQATMTWPYGNTGGLTIYAAWIAYDTTGVLHVSETEMFLLP